jgi:hypothetical protein
MGKVFITTTQFMIVDREDVGHVFTVDCTDADGLAKALSVCATETKGHKDSDVAAMHAFDKFFRRTLGDEETERLYGVFPAGKHDWMNMVMATNEITSAIQSSDALDVEAYQARIRSYLPPQFAETTDQPPKEA